MATTYTVVKGDTLSELAVKFNTTVSKLVALNDIADPDYIVVGQVLKIDGTASDPTTNTSSKANIKVFGLQSNTDRTVYATWTWDKDNTENYEVLWYYDSGDGVWFVGSDNTEKHKQSTYTAPSNAKRVKFKVKPISKKKTVNGKETSYWTASWSTEKTFSFAESPPLPPSVPSVEIEKYKLTAKLENLASNIKKVQFQIVKNNETVFKTGTATVSTTYVSYSCTVDAGAEYKVRCRGYTADDVSEWTEYSGNVKTIPSAPKTIKTIRASSETSVYLEWDAVATAETYELEYTTKKEYFDLADATTTIPNIEFTKYEKTGLETGEEYFFRVRAVNEKGETAWSEIVSVAIGKRPAAPTTWSSSTTVTVGEPLNLYWVHNSEDGSSQTYAILQLIIDGVEDLVYVKNSTDEEEKDKTSVYSIDTTDYSEGTTIQWRVKTAGVTVTGDNYTTEDKYSDWSIQRTIDIYAPPTLELNMIDNNGNDLENLTSFPFYIRGLAGPSTQLPIGYHLTVTANEAYETVDQIGNTKFISKDEQVYSRYYDISDMLMVELSAHSLDLENNIPYTVSCVVSMNSGLTAESSLEFTVSWDDIEYEPNAEIAIDEDTLVAHIKPYCEDNRGGIMLSVYRREFDGTFVEIASGIPNNEETFVTDPHPALDYARYRVVATTNDTGAISYCDLPGYPIGEKAAIIQWGESWHNFDTSEEDEMEEPAWSGSMLKLPYNIDVSDKRNVDVALIEYIGRAHPISYYGTQLGESSTWTMEIPKDDKDTLYTLRRLSIWTGDVYVREPSGSGYWAYVSVSFNQKHCEVTIPVTLEITRVEGGI